MSERSTYKQIEYEGKLREADDVRLDVGPHSPTSRS